MRNKKSREMEQMIKAYFSSYKSQLVDYQCVLNSDVKSNRGKIFTLAGYELYDGEKDSSICIEVVQSIEDLLKLSLDDFTFDINYICVSSALVGQAIRSLRSRCDIGIIEYTDAEEYDNITLMMVKQAVYNDTHNRDDCLWKQQGGIVFLPNTATNILYDKNYEPRVAKNV